MSYQIDINKTSTVVITIPCYYTPQQSFPVQVWIACQDGCSSSYYIPSMVPHICKSLSSSLVVERTNLQATQTSEKKLKFNNMLLELIFSHRCSNNMIASYCAQWLELGQKHCLICSENHLCDTSDKITWV